MSSSRGIDLLMWLWRRSFGSLSNTVSIDVRDSGSVKGFLSEERRIMLSIVFCVFCFKSRVISSVGGIDSIN